MSMETWLGTYFEGGDAAVRKAAEAGDSEALRHSIRKWEGAWEDALELHGLRKANNDCEIEERWGGQWFGFGLHTCALCQRHLVDTQDGPVVEHTGEGHESCGKCPLVRKRDGDVLLACYEDADDDEEEAPYTRWTEYNDPGPMLALMKDVLRRLEGGQ